MSPGKIQPGRERQRLLGQLIVRLKRFIVDHDATEIRAYSDHKQPSAADDHQAMGARGIALAKDALWTGDRTALDNAIELLQRAVAATPLGHPDRADYLSYLGAAFSTRFAVMAAPAGHPNREGTAGTRYTFAYGQYRMAYEIHGSGDRVLVWLHDLLLDANLSRHLARGLAAQGNRVVLLDLLGHGRSDRPRQAGALRMDLYAEQVLCLLDELGVEQAVLGGVSLGTNVSLLTAAAAPERVRGLVLEMPVLESGVPAAVGVYMPVLILAHYGRRVVRLLSRAARRVPETGVGALDSFVSAVASDPDETAAVLRGVLNGPIVPTSDQRRAITAPALVLGHGMDLVHSFTDAERLTSQLPNAELMRTRTFAELWVQPARLTDEISAFLNRVWEDL